MFAETEKEEKVESKKLSEKVPPATVVRSLSDVELDGKTLREIETETDGSEEKEDSRSISDNGSIACETPPSTADIANFDESSFESTRL